MPALTESDTIRMLVATDNHVGYAELDPIRKDDSWRSFDEIMTLARERDVDMVLLAGDLFHDNKPSRQAMYQVMRSLRLNCLGEKPCELEMLSDRSEAFEGAFNHVNYEDPDINVAIPVFSIHGNHDDPTGDSHLAALDLLQMGGLINYYGRTPESDNLQIRPVLLQKGRTKLALYGMSNVRDERLFRTFRDRRVKFFRPATQGSDWFNLMSVHQNRHAYTDTGYLPENFLPDFMDLVVWGHEHECLINPTKNADTGVPIMQPGSSIATSLDKTEAVSKHVAFVSITGREYHSEPIRLRTVRPFKMKEIALADDAVAKRLLQKDDHRTELTRRLVEHVDGLIGEANAEWREQQAELGAGDADGANADVEPPLPLVRLRVECTPPEGSTGAWDCENPQRFSNRFQGRVANVNDVVQFHRRKKAASRGLAAPELPDPHRAAAALDTVKVERLVRAFLAAQQLSLLPQNSFGDAVAQFVDKDDKKAMEAFVSDSLHEQVKHLLNLDPADAETEERLKAEMTAQIAARRKELEEQWASGARRPQGRTRLLPQPDYWDSDADGPWADAPQAQRHSDGESDDDEVDADQAREPAPAARGRGRPTAGAKKNGTAGRSAAAKKPPAAAAKKAPPAKKPSARGRKKQIPDDEDDEDDDGDIIMDDLVDDDVDDDDAGAAASQPLFVESQAAEEEDDEDDSPPRRGPGRKGAAAPVKAATAKAAPKSAARPTRAAAPSAPAKRQTRLNLTPASQSQAPSRKAQTRAPATAAEEIEDDEDDDGFDGPPPSARTRRK